MHLSEFEPFFTALFIGALVGVERTHHLQGQGGSLAGIRTFMLFAVLGALASWLARAMGSSLVFVGGLLSVTAVVLAGYVMQRRKNEDSVGVTTEMAAVVVYVLGALTVYGSSIIAVALAIVTASLLAMKATLHAAVNKVSRDELTATLRLLFASFIVLPLLPNRTIDPWGALNPFKLWMLVILISAISMVGYVAVRLVGASRGTLFTGLFGGLVSSTAVTLTFARQSREEPELSQAFATGTLIAWTVMFLRIIVLVGILSWPLLSKVAWPLGVMAFAGIAMVALALRGYLRNSTSTPHELGLKNPFRLRAAIQFAAIFAVMLVVSKLVQHSAPGQGLYWFSALAGSTDADAIVLSLTELFTKNEVSSLIVTRGIVIAAIANTIVKLILISSLGSRQTARRIIPATVILAALGAAALVFMVG